MAVSETRRDASGITRHLGRISLFLALGSWISYIAVLFIGGIDPPPALSLVLRNVVLVILVVAVVAVVCGLFALIRGPQRLSAATGLVASCGFLLLFTGAGLAVLS